MRTYHGKHIYPMLLIKFLNLLELYVGQVFISSNQLCEYYTLLWYIHIFNIVLRYGDRRIQLISIAMLFYKNVTFDELKILKFEDIYLFNLGKFIYQYKHKLLPDCFECPLLFKFTITIPVNPEHLASLIAGQILAYFLLIIEDQNFSIRWIPIYVIHHLFLVFNLS
jgi:hypothetical protein